MKFLIKSSLLCTLWLPSFLACQPKIEIIHEGPAEGKITTLDNSPVGTTGWWPSIALDRHNNPHLSYCDAYNGDLKYATRNSKQWTIETIRSEGKVGKYTSIAVAPNGTIGITYYNQDLKTVNYIYKTTDGIWTNEQIAWGLEAGWSSELRFDSENRAHLLYYLSSGKFIHAMQLGHDEWKKKIIFEAAGSFTIRIDAQIRNNTLWTSFVKWRFKDTTLYLGKNTSLETDDFEIETVTETDGPGWQSQLIFDAEQPSVLFTSNKKSTLNIATKKDKAWHTTVLYHRVRHFVSQQASNGDITIALEVDDPNNVLGRNLYLLRRKAGNWVSQLIESIALEAPETSYLALSVDNQGKAILAYYSEAIKGLKIYDETSLATSIIKQHHQASSAPPNR